MSKLEIGIKGLVQIFDNKSGLVFIDHNQIEAGAEEIVAACLTQLNGIKQIDTMVVTGDFGTVTKQVSASEINTNAVTLKTVVLEDDFNGTITSLELRSNSAGNLLMATKDDLSIVKDGESRVQINWTITIIVNP